MTGTIGRRVVLNPGWPAVFFGLRMPGAALAVIISLPAAIVATARLFRTEDRLAGILYLPYSMSPSGC